MLDRTVDVAALMADLGRRAQGAARVLATTPAERKNEALHAIARAVEDAAPLVLAANGEDVARAEANGMGAAGLDRLRLDAGRVQSIAEALRATPSPPACCRSSSTT